MGGSIPDTVALNSAEMLYCNARWKISGVKML